MALSLLLMTVTYEMKLAEQHTTVMFTLQQACSNVMKGDWHSTT
jgi:hypothetical protein